MHFSNIVTHHAEDGSGVGSAITAGKSFYHFTRKFHSFLYSSYDKDKKGIRSISQCLSGASCIIEVKCFCTFYDTQSSISGQGECRRKDANCQSTHPSFTSFEILNLSCIRSR